MEEVIQKCTNCKQIPDDILMLSCDHDLCLNCAAIIFCSENSSSEARLLTCLECWKSTELDKSSVYELKKINVELQIQKKLNSSDVKRQKAVAQNNEEGNNDGRGYDQRNQLPFVTQNYRINNEEMINPSNNALENIQAKLKTNIIDNPQILNEQQQNSLFKQPQQQQSIQLNPSLLEQESAQFYNQPQQLIQQQLQLQQQQQQQQLQQQQQYIPPQQTKRFCQDHHEEEILYYCFQCQSRCICPECVIHGAHKDHQVKTIKKAYPIVKQQVEEFTQKMDIKLKQISQRNAHLDSVCQELEGNTQNQKKQIAMIFSEIRQKLEAKEREVISICDQVLVQNLKEIENINFCLEEKLIDFKQTLELVFDHQNQSDETLLLDFYGTNQQKLEEIKESREWEKKLLYNNPEYYQISQREIQKQLALVENQLQKIEPQIEVKDQHIINGNNEMKNSQTGYNQPSYIQNDHTNLSQNQINTSGVLKDFQHQTPSASKRNQIPIYKPQQNQQQQQYSESMTSRTPLHNVQLDDPFRTQQITKDLKISDADFDKLREKLVNKQKQQTLSPINNQNSQKQQQQQLQTFQSGNVAMFTQNPSLTYNSQQLNNPSALNQNSYLSNQNSQQHSNSKPIQSFKQQIQ